MMNNSIDYIIVCIFIRQKFYLYFSFRYNMSTFVYFYLMILYFVLTTILYHKNCDSNMMNKIDFVRIRYSQRYGIWFHVSDRNKRVQDRGQNGGRKFPYSSILCISWLFNVCEKVRFKKRGGRKRRKSKSIQRTNDEVEVEVEVEEEEIRGADIRSKQKRGFETRFEVKRNRRRLPLFTIENP